MWAQLGVSLASLVVTFSGHGQERPRMHDIVWRTLGRAKFGGPGGGKCLLRISQFTRSAARRQVKAMAADWPLQWGGLLFADALYTRSPRFYSSKGFSSVCLALSSCFLLFGPSTFRRATLSVRFLGISPLYQCHCLLQNRPLIPFLDLALLLC